ncbi:MAG UNVERIFIED_CONTAM: hypothetical protein LVT10_04780 [Anaerolineae bacterium]|jgi:uncharacterized protein YyaL (SSP411 family)
MQTVRARKANSSSGNVDELVEVLGQTDAEMLMDYYGVTMGGNFGGKHPTYYDVHRRNRRPIWNDRSRI